MKLGIIGGSGLNELLGMTETREEFPETPYGRPSAPLQTGKYVYSVRSTEKAVMKPNTRL